MKRILILTTVLGIFAFFGAVWAATDDFTAISDFTVTGINLGAGSTDLTIKSGSKAASFGISAGVFSLTDPDTTTGFIVAASNASVKALSLKSGATNLACVDNTNPGTTVFTVTQAAGTYTIVPLEGTCGTLCPAQAHVATFSGFPACTPASCDAGYALLGGACVLQNTGGGDVTYYNEDNTAPIISEASFDQGKFFFKTNESAKATFIWGTSSESLPNEIVSESYDTSHEFVLEDISLNTVYYYKITVFDLASNEAEQTGSFEQKTEEGDENEGETPSQEQNQEQVQVKVNFQLPTVTAQDLVPTKPFTEMSQKELLVYILKFLIFSGRIR